MMTVTDVYLPFLTQTLPKLAWFEVEVKNLENKYRDQTDLMWLLKM